MNGTTPPHAGALRAASAWAKAHRVRGRWSLPLVWLAGACAFDPGALPPESADSGAVPVDSGVFRVDSGVAADAAPARCGDGIVRGPMEACDDGDRMDGDGCSRDCALEPGFTCAGAPSSCTNPPPIALDDRIRTREETAVDIDVLANDRDAADDVLAVVTTGTPALGRLALSASGAITFTPRLDAWGTDRFRYTIRDTRGQTASATVTVIVDPTNDVPRTGDLSLRTAFEAGVDVRLDAFDPDGHTLRYIVTPPRHGTLGLVDQIGASVRYTPQRGFVGVDRFGYRASDGSGLMSRTASVTIVVLPRDWRVPDAEARRSLCVDGSTLAAPLDDFPVPVVAPRGAFAGAGAGGADLVFQGDSGGRLVHDVERWVPDGTSVVWTRLPRVETSTTCVWVYFGRAAPGPGPDAAEVWSRDFSSVVHLDARARDVRAGQPLVVSGTSTVTGVLGEAFAFDGSARVDLASGLVDTGRGTLTAWVRVDAALDLTTDALLFYGARASAGAGQGFGDGELHLGLDAEERLRFFVWGDPALDLVASGRIASSSWRHVAVTWAQGGDAVIYVDGVERGRARHDGERFTTTALVRLGAAFDPTAGRFVGALDELRVADVVRSEAWLRAERVFVVEPRRVRLGPLDDGIR